MPYPTRKVAHLPFLDREPVGGLTTEVCDAWSVRRQTYGYLSSRRASPPLDRYEIILLGDRGKCVYGYSSSQSNLSGYRYGNSHAI